jgi:hypothetical protein
VSIDTENATNPVLNLMPDIATRDPALYYHGGIFYCYYSAVDYRFGGNDGHWFIEMITSTDLCTWSAPKRITPHGLNFSRY